VNLYAAAQVNRVAAYYAPGTYPKVRKACGGLNIHTGQGVPGLPIASAKKLQRAAQPIARYALCVRRSHANQLWRTNFDDWRREAHSAAWN
jgi:hypothetical protein